MTENLQDRYAPHNRCFGCGPANEKGLRIKSRVEGEVVVADFRAEPHHEAFDGMVCGGIIGTLLDCHMNWTAAWHLMERTGAESPPCTVTAKYEVKMAAPTPSAAAIRLTARVVESSDRKAVVEGELAADGTVTATGSGVFVAVKEGHPAWHRW
jgi:acyl-coenzyme A thioesterase PaaI-like protein